MIVPAMPVGRAAEVPKGVTLPALKGTAGVLWRRAFGGTRASHVDAQNADSGRPPGVAIVARSADQYRYRAERSGRCEGQLSWSSQRHTSSSTPWSGSAMVAVRVNPH